MPFPHLAAQQLAIVESLLADILLPVLLLTHQLPFGVQSRLEQVAPGLSLPFLLLTLLLHCCLLVSLHLVPHLGPLLFHPVQVATELLLLFLYVALHEGGHLLLFIVLFRLDPLVVTLLLAGQALVLLIEELEYRDRKIPYDTPFP